MSAILCEGWWEQTRFGRQPMEGLCLHFSGGRITGQGTDIIGDFDLSGEIQPDGAVRMLKTYRGKHSVDYQGAYDGEGTMQGRWYIGPCRGEWQIRLARAIHDGSPIPEWP